MSLLGTTGVPDVTRSLYWYDLGQILHTKSRQHDPVSQCGVLQPRRTRFQPCRRYRCFPFRQPVKRALTGPAKVVAALYGKLRAMPGVLLSLFPNYAVRDRFAPLNLIDGDAVWRDQRNRISHQWCHISKKGTDTIGSQTAHVRLRFMESDHAKNS